MFVAFDVNGETGMPYFAGRQYVVISSRAHAGARSMPGATAAFALTLSGMCG